VLFCHQCGSQAGQRDFFCGKCGARQPIPGIPGVYRAGGEGLSDRTASLLCYIPFVGWIAALLVLAAERFRNSPEVRFHAFQGLYLFVAWLLVDWAMPWFRVIPWFSFPLRSMLKALVLGLWIFMMVKASREERYSLPLFGDLAARSL